MTYCLTMRDWILALYAVHVNPTGDGVCPIMLRDARRGARARFLCYGCQLRVSPPPSKALVCTPSHLHQWVQADFQGVTATVKQTRASANLFEVERRLYLLMRVTPSHGDAKSLAMKVVMHMNRPTGSRGDPPKSPPEQPYGKQTHKPCPACLFHV